MAFRDRFGLNYVKKAAAEFALDKAIRYVTRDPEKNVMALLDFAGRVAYRPEHKTAIQSLKNHFQNHPEIMRQAKRVAKNPDVLSQFMSTWVVNNNLIGKSRREELSRELGVGVPTLILMDPTSACNLRCTGCWAGEYAKSDKLEPELFERILNEAKELGIYWIVLSGGEPFMYPHLLDIAERHKDMVFMVYTNGTLIDEKTADRMAATANMSPTFSLEGWREQTDARRGQGTFDKVMKAMDLMLERGIFFGVSVTVTQHNINELFSDEFIKFLVDKGAVYMWSFHYVPIGRNPDVNLMITPEQRRWLAYRVPELRTKYPILIADFWNDGEATGGCIAGGRTYFHINAAGDVEPCAFVHFAVDNIREKSLREVLKNPLFVAYQRRQPFNDNHLCPCPIIDNPQALRDAVKESGARPTHAGAEQVLEGEIASHLDNLSARWHREADRIMSEKQANQQKQENEEYHKAAN